ncbi:hypothetical protein EDD11_010030 [Mortierella claussenii]|nr:hypothetical protein EDD11_010030 [Mortierella claussenii]
MGQVNSKQASGDHTVSEPSPPSHPPVSAHPGSTSSSDPSAPASVPSVEDLRNLTNRILSSTGEALKNLRENMPSIELPSSLSSKTPSPSSSDTASALTGQAAVGVEAAREAGTSVAAMTDGVGLATGSRPAVTVMSSNDSDKVLVYRPLSSPDVAQHHQPSHPSTMLKSISVSEPMSTANLIKMYYQLSVDWAKNNPKKAAMGALGLVTAVVIGTVAMNALKAHREQRRRLRVLKGKDGEKREAIVILNVATLEGTALALSLEQEGFVVFVGVPNQVRADEVEHWGRADIRPVVVDMKKTNPVDHLVKAVSSFLDQHNGVLLGDNPIITSEPTIYQEELSSSTANIRLINPEHTLKSLSDAEAKRRHNSQTDGPLYRLAAVILNPHSVALGSIEKVDLELWRHSIDANITGTVIATQKFLPLLRRTLALTKPRRSPRVIFISSAITGSIGFPYQSAICASHHAIESIADSLRREIKPQGIDVICLRPGITDRSFRKEWSDKHGKAYAGQLGLFNTMDPTKILKTVFQSASTTSMLCDVVYDSITSKKPASCTRVGNGSLSYSFVGWAVPRYLVDWSIKGKPAKVYTPSTTATAKVFAGPNAHEE